MDATLPLQLLALGIGFLVSLDITRARAGLQRIPRHAGWCWLLILSGSLLIAAYGLEAMLWHVQPLLAFLALSIALLTCAIVVRRFVGPAWAGPLDSLTLYSLSFTLLLSLGQRPEVASTYLLGYAALLYTALLFQQRPLPTVLTACLLLLALPLLLTHAPFVLALSIGLPLLAAGMERLGVFQGRTSKLRHFFAWTLLIPAFAYGLAYAFAGSTNGPGAEAGLPIAWELALLGTAWYLAALLAGQRSWLLPTLVFWPLALLWPGYTFWTLSALTPVLLGLLIVSKRYKGGAWTLPFYVAALLCACLTAYSGLVQNEIAASSWVLLGFALLVYVTGLVAQSKLLCWFTPLFATWAVFVAAGWQGDLLRPLLVVCISLGLGLVAGRTSQFWGREYTPKQRLRLAVPLYVTALSAALLTGIYGQFGDINRPFTGALPAALLFYALLLWVVLRLDRRESWTWLVAVFACWGTYLTHTLDPLYILVIGTGLAFLGLILSQIPPHTGAPMSSQQKFFTSRRWSWPWYLAFLASTIVLAVTATGPLAVPALLIFTALSVTIMLVERAPQLLILPVALAALSIYRTIPATNAPALILAYTLLCLLIFATQFIWQLLPDIADHLPAAPVHTLFAFTGLAAVIVVDSAWGGLAPNAGLLAQAGILALVLLSALCLLYGQLKLASVTRTPITDSAAQSAIDLLAAARATRHSCFYIAGLLLALVVSWEVLAFGQTRLDLLTLAPASYLVIIAPFVLRDTLLPPGRVLGQTLALLGAALLLLPTLWLSLNQTDLLPTLVLLGEALLLLALGMLVRLRTFILSAAALVIAGTLHMLFLSLPGSVSILLMASGSILVLLATVLLVFRHRLQIAWGQWD